MSEEWRDVIAYNGLYSVSNLGRVRRNISPRNRKDRILNPSLGKNGYFCINLCMNSRVKMFYVHGLVMLSFIGERPEGKEINHINRNRKDNNLSNLEYICYQNNSRHVGEDNGLSKLTDNIVRIIRSVYRQGIITQEELAMQYNVSQSLISDVVLLKNWKHIL